MIELIETTITYFIIAFTVYPSYASYGLKKLNIQLSDLFALNFVK